MIELNKAQKSVENARTKAERCMYRPKYHFIAPAQWMNDPNGTIFYKGEYHMFYQFNPYGTRWGSIHWGHAKSKDLVHWEHLPIALYPSKELGENHCFSGCCVINDGKPSILYTSIGSLLSIFKGASQWLATSDDDMLTWEKYPVNPVIDDLLHEDMDARNWRDPYVWRENDMWFAVLGGQANGEKNGSVFLYKSHNLKKWEYIGILCKGNKALGKNWECPNFFRLGNKHLLIVSPHSNVIYALGTFDNNEFIPETWQPLDLGKSFYATNTIIEKDRVIVFGWIKYGWLWGKNISGWNGCISLPRILTLDSRNKLMIQPAPELQILRKDHFHKENQEIIPDSSYIIHDTHDNCMEIRIKFDIFDESRVGFNILNCKGKVSIGFDIEKQEFFAGKEKGKFDFPISNKPLDFHIFIDKSVVELFINNKTCFTTRFYPKKNKKQEIELFSTNGRARISELDVWGMKSIW